MDSIQFSHKGDRFVCNDGLFTVRNEKIAYLNLQKVTFVA